MYIEMMDIEVVLSTRLTDTGEQILRFPSEDGLMPIIITKRLNLPRDSVGFIALMVT
jgi:hypothetical protein